jgi:2-(1,2-epoxy-1,2-dihydrophenyl)acetyl-CoA isomerase
LDPILIENRGTWRILTLNRPDRLNAFNPAMHLALAKAFDDIAADIDCRAVLLTGAGRGFCAGQDLSEIGGDLGSVLQDQYNPLVRGIRTLNKPVVCAVNGTAAGAGANIALACDIVLAARSARFIQSFAKIGLVPDSGGTWFLPRLVGDARARALALLAEPIPAETAKNWGLIWRVVDDDQLKSESEKLAAYLAGQPTQALALIKQAFAQSATNSLDAQLDLERDLQRKAGATPDYAEGVNAFIAKRPPKFTGRPQ